MDFALPNRESFQRLVVFPALLSKMLWPPAWSERVGELGDAEDALAVKSSSLFLSQAGEQAEVVFLNRLLAAS